MPSIPDFLNRDKQIPLPGDDIYFWQDYFEQYLPAMERFIESESLAIRERYQNDYYGLRNAETYLEALEDFFPDILRRSFFMAAYSLAEAELDDRCRAAKTRKQLSLSHTDLKGQGIPRARIYLAKVIGITIPNSLKSLWDELDNYRKIRNCLAHNQNRLTSNKDGNHLREQYIPDHQRYICLDGPDDDEIILHKGFCEKAISTIRAFFQELDEAEKMAA